MSRIDTGHARPLSITMRFIIGVFAAILVPPFVLVAVAPLLFFLIPCAFVAIPFMLSAFAGEVREVPAAPRRVRALSHATSH
jgi:hypothetical protein